MSDILENLPLFLRWENSQNRRYYQVYLDIDMMQDYLLTKSWGGIGKSSGRVVYFAYSSYTEAITEVKKILQVRKRRGYTLVSLPPAP